MRQTPKENLCIFKLGHKIPPKNPRYEETSQIPSYPMNQYSCQSISMRTEIQYLVWAEAMDARVPVSPQFAREIASHSLTMSFPPIV